MKAVAARLGPYSAMALYRYVHSKDGLVDLMLDAATAEIPLPAQPGPGLAGRPAGPGRADPADDQAASLVRRAVPHPATRPGRT